LVHPNACVPFVGHKNPFCTSVNTLLSASTFIQVRMYIGAHTELTYMPWQRHMSTGDKGNWNC